MKSNCSNFTKYWAFRENSFSFLNVFEALKMMNFTSMYHSSISVCNEVKSLHPAFQKFLEMCVIELCGLTWGGNSSLSPLPSYWLAVQPFKQSEVIGEHALFHFDISQGSKGELPDETVGHKAG